MNNERLCDHTLFMCSILVVAWAVSSFQARRAVRWSDVSFTRCRWMALLSKSPFCRVWNRNARSESTCCTRHRSICTNSYVCGRKIFEGNLSGFLLGKISVEAFSMEKIILGEMWVGQGDWLDRSSSESRIGSGRIGLFCWGVGQVGPPPWPGAPCDPDLRGLDTTPCSPDPARSWTPLCCTFVLSTVTTDFQHGVRFVQIYTQDQPNSDRKESSLSTIRTYCVFSYTCRNFLSVRLICSIFRHWFTRTRPISGGNQASAIFEAKKPKGGRSIQLGELEYVYP